MTPSRRCEGMRNLKQVVGIRKCGEAQIVYPNLRRRVFTIHTKIDLITGHMVQCKPDSVVDLDRGGKLFLTTRDVFGKIPNQGHAVRE